VNLVRSRRGAGATLHPSSPWRGHALFNLFGRMSEGRFWAYILLLPSLILMLAVILYPTVSALLLSLRQMQLTRPALGTGFVGFAHYSAMLHDDVFWIALLNTAMWVTATVVLELMLGMIAALALNRGLPGSRAMSVLILLPWFLPSVVAANMWALLLDPRLGVLNDLLVHAGVLAQPKAWFADPNTALWAAVLVEAWHGFPFFALLLLAGLQTIPDELYQAASVDGAQGMQQFRNITLPLLRMVIAAAVILRVIGLVNSPDLILILTNGGPGHATEVLSLYAFSKAYQEFDFGYASALSVMMFLMLMIFSWVYVRISRVMQE
jgi:multiple sugar transport system permease protein